MGATSSVTSIFRSKLCPKLESYAHELRVATHIDHTTLKRVPGP